MVSGGVSGKNSRDTINYFYIIVNKGLCWCEIVGFAEHFLLIFDLVSILSSLNHIHKK